MFKRFLKEKSGGLFEYIIILSVAGVTLATLFPGFRTNLGNWFSGTTDQAQVGISGSTSTTSNSAWSKMNGGGSSTTGSGSNDLPSDSSGNPSDKTSTTINEGFENTNNVFGIVTATHGYNNTSFPWKRSTDKAYQESYSYKAQGAYDALNGYYLEDGTYIASGGENYASVQLTVPSGQTGALSLEYSVSSQLNSDYLIIWVDYKKVVQVSGEVKWQNYQISGLMPGKHYVQFCYVKDDDGDAGSDAAWIDDISFTLK